MNSTISIIFLLVISFLHIHANSIYAQNRIDSLNKALSNQNISNTAKVDLLYKLSLAYYSEKKIENSLEYSRIAVMSYDLVNDQIGKAEALKQCGILYSELNDYKSSLKHFLNALEIFQTNNQLENCAKTKNEIISLYQKMGNYNNAIDYLNSNLNYYNKDKIRYKDEIINCNFYLGISYGGKEILDSALLYFNKCIKYYQENKDNLKVAGLLNNIGAIYSKQDKNKEAFENYNKALLIFKEINNETGIGVSLSNIAYIHKKQKDYNNAISCYETSIQLFLKTRSLHYLNNTYLDLSEIYKNIGKYDKALAYNELYIQLNDSLKNSEVLSKIADLEIQHKVSNKEKELKLIEKEKQLIEKENKIRKTNLWILAGLIIFLLVIAILVFRNLKISLQSAQLKKNVLEQEKTLLKDELSFKNSELEQLAIRIVQKNDFLEELKLKFENLKNATADMKVKDISNEIDNVLYIDNDRNELELKIDHIHQTFLNKLSQRFPDLTKTEKRLCSFLILEISSKDIATLMNISPDSVKKSRYRLRKKLGIETDEDITNFLKNI